MKSISQDRSSRVHRTTSGKDLAVEMIRLEFSRRLQKNPSYSQRAFAKFLGVSHTLLSLVLNGHRPPSDALLATIAERLEFGPKKAQMFLGQEVAKGSEAGSVAGETLKLSLDQFALVSEWQHFAILSLLEVPDSDFDAKFIAARLGISVMLAKISMDRLTTSGLVAKGRNGKWRQSTKPIVVENKLSTVSTKRFQRQLLAKAAESLTTDPIEKRDLSSTTFAMNPKHVGYALKRIREFRRALTNELEAFGEPEEVYNLTVQIFPTSRRTK
jgi:uncharacterized protein (TIGR02147 family)